MMKYKNKLAPAFLTLGLLFGVYSCTTVAEPENTKADKAKEDTGAVMNAESIALAEKMIFEQKGFRLGQKTQEGTTAKERLTQDTTQRICSALGGKPADSETAAKIMEIARESITIPASGIKLGDWKKGEAIARSGYGFRVGHKTDNHSKRSAGGNCYACHQLDPNEIAYGTLGPSLKAYGKIRGSSDAMLSYAYGIIFNPHASFPCSEMPRFGSNEVLTEQQISDVMAYLFDPASPVNQ